MNGGIRRSTLSGTLLPAAGRSRLAVIGVLTWLAVSVCVAFLSNATAASALQVAQVDVAPQPSAIDWASMSGAPPVSAPNARSAAEAAATPKTEPVIANPTSYEIAKLKIDSAFWFVGFTLIAAVIFVGLFYLMQFFDKTTDDFSKHFVVMMVIISSILLLVMGYTQEQIAPAFGLLGTILGYMFGRVTTGSTEKKP